MPSHHSPGQCHTCDVTLSTSETLCLIMVRDCSTIAQMTKLTSVSLTVSAGDLTSLGIAFFLLGNSNLELVTYMWTSVMVLVTYHCHTMSHGCTIWMRIWCIAQVIHFLVVGRGFVWVICY